MYKFASKRIDLFYFHFKVLVVMAGMRELDPIGQKKEFITEPRNHRIVRLEGTTVGSSG